MSTTTQIIPGAEPFFFPGDQTGCLLVHGFTGAPKEMRGLGEYLAEQGRTVLGIRLSGHATRPEDMLRVHWQDWLADLEDGLHLLQGHVRRVFVCGLSLGGALALLGAARFPLAGVVSMSTPYQLPPDPRLKWIRWLYPLQPQIAKGEAAWISPPAGYQHIEYPYYPTRAIIQVRDLLVELRQALPSVQAPALVIHSRNDEAISPDNLEQIYRHLGSREKQLAWIEGSSHNIVCDGQREQVFQLAGTFIEQQMHSRP